MLSCEVKVIRVQRVAEARMSNCEDKTRRQTKITKQSDVMSSSKIITDYKSGQVVNLS